MGHFLFFVSAVASCLLWSAAWTAAAARTRRPWLRRLLAAVAVLAPAIALLPWLALTAFLAFGQRMPTNWFGPVLTTFLSAAIGGIWIARAGLARSHDGPLTFSAEQVPLAARWPVAGLTALLVLATAVAGGTLLAIDNAVASRTASLRLEAGQLMLANTPAVVPESQNAATLYRQAFAALDGDPAIKGQDSPLNSAVTIDIASPAVTDLLARHASTLDLLRRAAARTTCRFQRDWPRPAYDMLLPELFSLRHAARLLVLEARRKAADAKAADALGDVACIGQLGRHAASEPLLVSNLVGLAIDTVALDTLAQVLPTLRKSDLVLLDAPELDDLVTIPPSTTSAIYGEEAVGLFAFAELADKRQGRYLAEVLATQAPRPFGLRILPLSIFYGLYRVFLLEADLAGYRSIMRQHQQIAAGSEPFVELKEKTDATDAELQIRSPGSISWQILPALRAFFRQQTRNVALHRAAAALIATTRQRLETGRLPATMENLSAKLAPPLSRDPFTADRPLLMKRTDDAIVVYSVGANGEDDGGPVAPGEETPSTNDDIGLRMPR